jgi:hypothetical protein
MKQYIVLAAIYEYTKVRKRRKKRKNKMGWGFVYVYLGNKGIGPRHGSMEQWMNAITCLW